MKKIIITVFMLLTIAFQNMYACVGTDVQLDINNVTCYNAKNGSVEVLETLISQNTPYTYSLNGGIFTNNPLFTNLSPGSYTLVVKDNAGCDYTFPQTIVISQPEQLTLNVQVQEIVCGDDAKLYAEINGGVSPYLYEWNNDSTSNLDTLRNVGAETYSLKIRDQNDCTVESSATVAPKDLLTVEAIASSYSVNIGDVVDLSSSVTNGSTNLAYQWFPASDIECSTCSETTAQLFESKEIDLIVNDLETGCSADTTIYIEVDGSFTLYIPNAFSPNSDKRNEVFKIYGVGIDSTVLQVYDKNGFLIFEGDAYADGWDGFISGNPAPDGLYFYHAQVVYLDGTTREQKGQLTLIR